MQCLTMPSVMQQMHIVAVTVLILPTSLQLRADGSGAFPIPDQPDDRPFTEPPEQLLAHLATPAPAVVQTESPAADAAVPKAAHEADAVVHCSPDAAAELPVAVAPLSDFLTSDPSGEGPLPEEARNLVRPSRRSTAVEHSFASVSIVQRRQVDCIAVDVMPACGSPFASSSDGTGRMSSEDKGNPADGSHELDGSRVAVDQNGCSSMLCKETVSQAGQKACTGCGTSADSDGDPWQPFWLPDAEVSARGAVMDIVTVRLTSSVKRSPLDIPSAWPPTASLRMRPDDAPVALPGRA